jgi:predicted Zn-dependent peptidase
MSLTIELTPQAEAWVQSQARELGVAPADVVRQLIDTQAARPPYPAAQRVDRSHFYFTASDEEFNPALDEIADMNRGAPALPEEAFDRENLYEDRL